MARINWGRLFLGSLIAAIIMFVTDGLIHETILKADWRALYTALRATEPKVTAAVWSISRSSNSAVVSRR